MAQLIKTPEREPGMVYHSRSPVEWKVGKFYSASFLFGDLGKFPIE